MITRPLPTTSILVVDDDEDNCCLVRRAFGQAYPGLEVVTVGNGEEALLYLNDAVSLPALLITDLNMPRVNGVGLLTRLRQCVAFQDLPALVLTTSDDKGDTQRCFRAGANAFLTKPTSTNDLEKLIRSIVCVWLPGLK